MPENSIDHIDFEDLNKRSISPHIITHLYTADPSAHVFDGKIYIYPSHDIDAGDAFDDLGSHFAMEDYHVFSMEDIDSEVKDHGIALHVDNVKWAEKQMWAPDANEKDGKYYLFFPAKDYKGIFRIGVAISDKPSGPFIPLDEPIKGSYSIDPAVFKDDDGSYYMYFGGLWGGQLQKYRNNIYSNGNELRSDDDFAFGPLVAELSDDMRGFSTSPEEIIIQDENGNPLLAGDNSRRYFEGPWVHKYNEKYYLSYSTGDTHFICYAIGDTPKGPFNYAGKILDPVVGWTTHHSICEFNGRWFLFYHDSSLSDGVTHLRCMKVVEIFYDKNGLIKKINPYS